MGTHLSLSITQVIAWKSIMPASNGATKSTKPSVCPENRTHKADNPWGGRSIQVLLSCSSIIWAPGTKVTPKGREGNKGWHPLGALKGQAWRYLTSPPPPWKEGRETQFVCGSRKMTMKPSLMKTKLASWDRRVSHRQTRRAVEAAWLRELEPGTGKPLGTHTAPLSAFLTL